MGGGVLLPAPLHHVTSSLLPGNAIQFRACDIMQFALLSNCWERILDEWANLGLFATAHASEEAYFKKQKERLAIEYP